jgi:FlaA1/EpsC-like NDP-sugar epimerase
MFTTGEASELIYKAIDYSDNNPNNSFILSRVMKTINMLTLASTLSNSIEVIGIRPGEKLNETLISNKELPYTKVIGNKTKYILILKELQDEKYNFHKELSSLTAEKMNKKEIYKLLQ